MVSRPAVSEATAQPVARRPRTSGCTPCGSRAAYSVFSSMNTRQNAPRSCGRTRSAASATDSSGRAVSSAVIRCVSEVVVPMSMPRLPTSLRSSAVLTRFPLWAKAIAVPAEVDLMVGWAFSHVGAPVVE